MFKIIRARFAFRIRFIGFLTVALFGAGSAPMLMAEPNDDAFLAARDAYSVRDLNKLDVLAPLLRGHLLDMYVAYWQLSSRVSTADAGEFQTFFTRYADTPLTERLRGEWLRELGRQANWELFKREYPLLGNDDPEIACYALQARLAHDEAEVFKEARRLWFSDKTSPDSCTPLFERMVGANQLSTDDLWQRVRLALDAGNTGLAKQVSSYLPPSAGLDDKAVDTAATDPQRYIDRVKRPPGSRAARETLLFAMIRLARNQSPLAADYLKKLAPGLPAKDLTYAWGQIAYRGALDHEPDALAWYAKAGKAPLTDTQTAWRVRAALRAQDWPEVLTGINHLSEVEQRESNWRYWKARALKVIGRPAEARDILLPLSRETHFYGLLAGEELGPTLSNPGVLWKPSDAEVAAVKQLPGIQRSLTLNRLQMPVEALREWSMATRGFDDRKTLAAAEVASRAGWIDRAINTADRTREIHDYSLRFPTPFRDSLVVAAHNYQLDEAWVYGLIRQESRFITEARSRAGAMGLMQLMPATARWVAGKLGIKNPRNIQVTDVDTNIALGTFYLRNVLDGLGHPVMATAGYNAGPGRARRWRAEGPLEGAIYAESIPFTETRDYVKKVMANATIYALQLGLKPQPLKQRMGVIPGRAQVIDANSGDLGPGS